MGCAGQSGHIHTYNCMNYCINGSVQECLFIQSVIILSNEQRLLLKDFKLVKTTGIRNNILGHFMSLDFISAKTFLFVFYPLQIDLQFAKDDGSYKRHFSTTGSPLLLSRSLLVLATQIVT